MTKPKQVPYLKKHVDLIQLKEMCLKECDVSHDSPT